jgi:hypothetical protein
VRTTLLTSCLNRRSSSTIARLSYSLELRLLKNIFFLIELLNLSPNYYLSLIKSM